MTSKTRNRMMALAIIAFPFVVLLGFVISQAIAPAPSNPPTPNQTDATSLNNSPK